MNCRFHHFRLLWLLFLTSAAQADTLYKCTDDDGRITYTNQKVSAKNCKILSQDQPVSSFTPPNRAPSRLSGGGNGEARPASSSPSDFPRVGASEQKARDNDRRAILDKELQSELKLLEAAKQALTEQETIRTGDERNYQKVLDRVQPYKDKVQLHERNIEALRKEIGNLR